jgi:hypothetical protein
MCEKLAAGTDLLGLTAVFFLINVLKINLYVYTLFVANLFCEKKINSYRPEETLVACWS